jgi:hypothetical protein
MDGIAVAGLLFMVSMVLFAWGVISELVRRGR